MLPPDKAAPVVGSVAKGLGAGIKSSWSIPTNEERNDRAAHWAGSFIDSAFGKAGRRSFDARDLWRRCRKWFGHIIAVENKKPGGLPTHPRNGEQSSKLRRLGRHFVSFGARHFGKKCLPRCKSLFLKPMGRASQRRRVGDSNASLYVPPRAPVGGTCEDAFASEHGNDR